MYSKKCICLLSLALAFGFQAQAKKSVSKSAAVAKPAVQITAPVVNFKQKARKAYQEKKFAEAIALYTAIPESDSSFVETREELGWAYLQAGQWTLLQGLVRDLNTAAVPMSNRLEGRVLSAITNLRLCDYQDVQKEIQTFQNEMRAYNKAVSKMKNEVAKSNQQKLMSEAILKMKFVRLELLNQVRLVQLLRKSNEVSGLQLASSGADPMTKTSAPDQMDFRVDESFWADEFLHKVSVEDSNCPSLQKGERL
jgi:tetratricopeptide (TPR) repeat protein